MDLTALIFPAILLGILLLVGGIFLIVINKQKRNASIDVKNQNDRNMSNSKKSTKGNVKSNTKETPKEDIFKFMEFDRILDNMIVQNDGTKFTMAIKCKGINYDLMSDVEQISVEEGFITFLNTLRYPIQLYVQAQNIDLKSAISTYKANASSIREEYEEANKKYNNLIEQFDANEEDIRVAEERRERVLNVYEYAEDIINYVERLSLNKNLLQRNFYVLVSYYTTEITSAESFTKEELVNICYNELLTRAQTIISALSACSVSGEVLSSNELADLLYTAYNRDDKGFLSVREAIQSGFYRLYSTSEDVFMKKQEKLQEQINIEAQYRALDAMKKAIKEGTYISPEVEQLDIVDRISKQAAEIVKNENLPDDVKKKANTILVEEYKEDKKRILESVDSVDETTKNSQDISKDNKDGSLEEDKNDKSSIENKLNNNSDIISSDVLDDRLGFDTENNINSNVNNEPEKKESTDSSEDDLII